MQNLFFQKMEKNVYFMHFYVDWELEGQKEL